MVYEREIREADLLLENKNLKQQIRFYKSGEKYQNLKKIHQKDLAAKDKEIAELKNEKAKLRAQIIDIREKWFQACEDVIAEKDAALAAKDKELEKMQQKLNKAEEKAKELRESLIQEKREKYAALTQIDELKGQIQSLTARVNRDYTNSSIPSSMSPNHKKIPNNREKTDKKPGGQPGHPHHERKKLEPTRTVQIAPPPEFTPENGYIPTGRTIHKQQIKLIMLTEVIDYETPEFYCKATGKTVHADFPDGIVDDVNYDGSVKAFAYLLNNACNVSIEKTSAFLDEVSGGKIKLSNGMICKLSREFSQKTEKERDQIFLDLVSAPTMHADFTFGRVNGKNTTVLICATDDKVLYQSHEKKGAEGVRGSPVEVYQGTIISDHESIFRKHGSRHQECLVHVERYLRSSVENEPERQWNSKMLALIQKLIHCRNEAVQAGNASLDASLIAGLEKEYDEILALAEREYDDEPPSKYFPDGYNLYKRMAKDKGDYLLFLQDLSIVPNNNLAETAARKYKRKSAQVMCFRSDSGSEYYCDGLSVMETIKAQEGNLYEGVAQRFNRSTERSE